MTTTTTTATTTPTCTTPKGFDLACPKCGAAADACAISLRLDMPEGEEFRCGECEAEFGIDEVRELVERWGALLRWLDTMPSCRVAQE